MSNVTISKFSDGTNTGYIAPQAYFTCSTAANTVAKTATSPSSVAFSDTSLVTGVTVWVKFTYGNTTATPTLKIGTSTVKTIKGACWQDGDVVSFTYDGTYWYQNEPTSLYFTGTLDVSLATIVNGTNSYGTVTLDNNLTAPQLYNLITASKKPAILSILEGGSSSNKNRAILESFGGSARGVGFEDPVGLSIVFRGSAVYFSLANKNLYFEVSIGQDSSTIRLYCYQSLQGTGTANALAKFNDAKGNIVAGPTINTSDTATFLRHDGQWATPSSSGGSRVVYTAYCGEGEVGTYQGAITLDDSKTGADVIADIESGNQVVIQIEDIESDVYEFTYSGARDNNTYVFTYVAHNSTNSQTALIVTAAAVTLKESAYMELVSNRVSSITSSSATTTYPNTRTVYNAISGGAISHYKLSTMTIANNANSQAITINDIVGGFDCAVNDVIIGTNGNYGHITSWSTSANPHGGTVVYDGTLVSGYYPTTGGEITGDVTLYKEGANPGDSYALIFQRGTLTDAYNDWRIQDRGGYLQFDQRGNGSSAWSNVAQMTTDTLTISKVSASTSVTAPTVTGSTLVTGPEIKATTKFSFGTNAYMQYDSTEEAVKFTFA